MKSVTKTREYKQAYGSTEPYHDDPVTEQPRRNRQGGASGGGYVQRVTNDEREDEMNENLG